MEFLVQQQPDQIFHEFTGTRISVPELGRVFSLDMDFSKIVDRSRTVEVRTLDFLFIAAVVYAVDKIARRDGVGKASVDDWSRTLSVSIPLQEPDEWTNALSALEEAVSFLTGDSWTFQFTKAEFPFQQQRPNRKATEKGYPDAPLVTLFSGGLDSFIGALDALTDHPTQNLLFVSHYDGHVSGPGSDQSKLRAFLDGQFAGRISHLKVRTGVRSADVVTAALPKYTFETTFRSRSLIFIGLGVYAASKIGTHTPLIIPENGPIALNLPLSASRRGSCSTRTVHPYFVEKLNEALRMAGITNPVSNPYAFKTKGEMVKDCKQPALLKAARKLSNSCGKAGRKGNWAVRTAKGCGSCVPCIFRRASLHKIGEDDEIYGNDVFVHTEKDFQDFSALLRLLHRNPSIREIERTLVANGRLSMAELDQHAGVVNRMLTEVKTWVREKGSTEARQIAGV